MSAAPESVTFEQVGCVARPTLNRPDRRNAIDVPMARALMELAKRRVVLAGARRMVCVSGDMSTGMADATIVEAL